MTPPYCDVIAVQSGCPQGAVAASHQQVAELHEVEHVALVHLGQLLSELDGLLPHLRRNRQNSFSVVGEGLVVANLWL